MVAPGKFIAKKSARIRSAYQGYATGSLDDDAFAVRLFEQAGEEFVMSQSFSKNLGLYGERVGCASVVCGSKDIRVAADTQLRSIIRPMYSNPPKHGCYIAKHILTDPENFKAWTGELEYMSNRILAMRKALRKALEDGGCPGTWNHITDQIGMFSYTGLTPTQVKHIEEKYHIYMLSSGRVSMAGVNKASVGYIAEAIIDAVKSVK
jgi:aspartate/tyrosine/aromatic aminotransferase